MDKNVSIVLVDKRPYREIARDNWGLTKKQMKGKHVHHRIRRSDGGTNDASNLYVCSPSFHRWGWHDGEEWIEWANEGAKKAHERKGEDGKSLLGKESAARMLKEKDHRGISVNASRGGRKGGKKTHARKNEDGKSIHALETLMKAHSEKTPEGKSILGVKSAERMHSIKDHEGKSANAVKGGKKRAQTMNQEKNEQGKSVHSLNAGKKGSRVTNSQLWISTMDGFISTAGPVANHNRARGWDPGARVKVSMQEIKR